MSLAKLGCTRSQQFWAGVMLGIATLIKPLFLLTGIYFLVRRRLQVGFGFCLSILTIVGSSILLFGIDIHRAWFDFCIRPYFGKVMVAFNNQSLDAFIGRLLSDVSLTTWWPPVELGWDFKLVRYVLLSLLVGVVIWVLWRSPRPTTSEEENLEFCIVLSLAILITPISWTHYYLYLLVPLSLYLGDQLAFPKGKNWRIPILISAFLISLPSIHIDSQNILIRFLVSYSFLGGLTLLSTLLAARWFIARNSKFFYEKPSTP
ncbi:MAG: DUF2029 domain-containing protein [Oscillatoriales cyanobacterium C42_A2020_001]|nr:DUF2029 domain-containing protein [Leptolyngbyaceae cyanobacterium C42_A2020_001]